jgi:hypothetical protein
LITIERNCSRPGLAGDPATACFMHAGESLLHEDLTRDAGAADPGSAGALSPFREFLAWVSRRRVVTAAGRLLDRSEHRGLRVTEKAFKYRWETQGGYLRDLAVWALGPRLRHPGQVAMADAVIDGIPAGTHQLSDAIRAIAGKEVAELRQDKSFRLQLVFQATLAHDPLVADMLHRIDQAHVAAWRDFAARSFGTLGLTLRPGMTFEDLGCALHMAGEGALLRAMLPERRHHGRIPPADLLALTAKALVLVSMDAGDGKALDDLLNDRVARALEDRG